MTLKIKEVFIKMADLGRMDASYTIVGDINLNGGGGGGGYREHLRLQWLLDDMG